MRSSCILFSATSSKTHDTTMAEVICFGPGCPGAQQVLQVFEDSANGWI